MPLGPAHNLGFPKQGHSEEQEQRERFQVLAVWSVFPLWMLRTKPPSESATREWRVYRPGPCPGKTAPRHHLRKGGLKRPLVLKRSFRAFFHSGISSYGFGSLDPMGTPEVRDSASRQDCTLTSTRPSWRLSTAEVMRVSLCRIQYPPCDFSLPDQSQGSWTIHPIFTSRYSSQICMELRYSKPPRYTSSPSPVVRSA